MRALLHSGVYPSQIFEASAAKRKVQDAYTLRCIPQIHGIVVDSLKFARDILTIEINSATDNPMVLTEREELISGGNFHGQYPSKALDFLAIAVQDIANVSERRIDRMLNNAYSEGLPPFLAATQGLHSGFMIAHCTAAALASENKVLCHPSSADTISTSGGTEDHVSMGGWSARKAIQVVRNVQYIVAVELLTACQALEIYHRDGLKTTEPLEAVFSTVRQFVLSRDEDRYMAPDIEAAKKLIDENVIWETVKPFIEKYVAMENGDKSLSCLL
jgi:histidine ammonia-lyase